MTHDSLNLIFNNRDNYKINILRLIEKVEIFWFHFGDVIEIYNNLGYIIILVRYSVDTFTTRGETIRYIMRAEAK